MYITRNFNWQNPQTVSLSRVWYCDQLRRIPLLFVASSPIDRLTTSFIRPTATFKPFWRQSIASCASSTPLWTPRIFWSVVSTSVGNKKWSERSVQTVNTSCHRGMTTWDVQLTTSIATWNLLLSSGDGREHNTWKRCVWQSTRVAMWPSDVLTCRTCWPVGSAASIRLLGFFVHVWFSSQIHGDMNFFNVCPFCVLLSEMQTYRCVVSGLIGSWPFSEKWCAQRH